jgi:hypothetical protein
VTAAVVVYEQVEMFEDGAHMGYRGCDVCFETAVNDFWANREARRFYRLHPDCITVCDGCLDHPEGQPQ